MAGRKYDPLPLLHISLFFCLSPPAPRYFIEITFYAFDLPFHSRNAPIFWCSATLYHFRGMEVETPSQAGVSMALYTSFFFKNKARGHLAFPCDCPIATLSCCRYASIDQWKVQGGFDSGSQTRSAVNKLGNKEPDFLPSCAQHRSQFQSLGMGASSLPCVPDTGWLLSLRSCLKCICSCLFS